MLVMLGMLHFSQRHAGATRSGYLWEGPLMRGHRVRTVAAAVEVVAGLALVAIALLS